MPPWLAEPAAQAGLASFITAFVVAAALARLRLAGLAAIAGLAAAAYLAGGLAFTPPTAMRKLMMLVAAAPALGLLLDLAFRPARGAEVALGVACGAASAWVFSAMLAQKPPFEALRIAGTVALFVAWTVGFTVSLQRDALRAGAAGLGLGLGVGAAALMAAAATLGLYGAALAAACGAFLLSQMLAGRRFEAGLAFALTVGAAGALLAAAGLLFARMRWAELAALALVPLAVRLPAPARWPVWAQALLLALYGLACGGAALAAAWWATRR